MTIKQHKEKVVRLMEGGIWSEENRLDDLYVYAVINSARAYVLRQDFIKFKRWSPTSLQTYYPEYDENFQDSVCYTRFELPTGFIQANSVGDGLVYFGSSTNKILTNTNFRRIKNRAELSDFLQHPTMSPASGRFMSVMIEENMCTIISKDSIKVKYPLIVGAFDDPTLLPTYNKEKDDYPLPNDLSNVMYDVISNGTMKMVYSRNYDSKDDGHEGTKLQTR